MGKWLVSILAYSFQIKEVWEDTPADQWELLTRESLWIQTRCQILFRYAIPKQKQIHE